MSVIGVSGLLPWTDFQFFVNNLFASLYRYSYDPFNNKTSQQMFSRRFRTQHFERIFPCTCSKPGILKTLDVRYSLIVYARNPCENFQALGLNSLIFFACFYSVTEK